MRINSIAKFAVAAFLCLLSESALAQETAGGRTLDECFGAALQQSETVAIQKELINQAEARYRQSIGRIMPLIEGHASYLRQEKTSSSLGGSGFGRDAYAEARISANQPLFRGFREFSYMKETKAIRTANAFDTQEATRRLYIDVAQNFYAILALEQEIFDIETEVDVDRKRLKDLQGRRRIGRSRPAEVLTVDATIARLLAETEQVRGRLRAEREVLVFLTGFPADAKLNDTEAFPNQLPPLDLYLQELEKRPDVQAEESRAKAAHYATRVAKGAHAPTLDATGNYYFVRTDSFSDLQRGPTWDAIIEFNLPIFAGGSIQAGVREAKSKEQQANLTAQRARRRADEEVRSLYQTLSSNIGEIAILEETVRLAKQTYEVNAKEYGFGLVSNIDVLQTLSAYQDSVRTLNRTGFATKFTWLRLEIAAARRLMAAANGTAP